MLCCDVKRATEVPAYAMLGPIPRMLPVLLILYNLRSRPPIGSLLDGGISFDVCRPDLLGGAGKVRLTAGISNEIAIRRIGLLISDGDA